MITSLTLTNFQSWKSLNLKLAPFTAILGQSGSGKTAIIRALKSILYTSPGSGSISHGEKVMRIEMEIDGHSLSWIKSATRNDYYLDSQDFIKVGRDTPEAVRSVMNFPSFSLDDEKYDLGISSQFDPPMLIFESPPKAARILSTVAGIDQLMLISKNISRDLKEAQKSLTQRQAELRVIEEDWKFTEKVKLAVSWIQKAPKVEELKNLVSHYQALQGLVAVPPPTPAISKSINLDSLSNLQNRLRLLPEPVNPPSHVISFDPLAVATLRLESLFKLQRDLVGFSVMKQDNARQIALLSAEEREISDLALEVGESCPICGSPVRWVA